MRGLSKVSGLLALLVASVCAAVLLSWSAPAFAHDRLLDADPADGSEVLQGEVNEVNLNFSAEPLELGNIVRVTDSKGTVLFEGEPTLEGTNVRISLKSAPQPGEMKVQWRVVSSDGHPISGTLAYTVKEDPAKPGSESGSDGADASDAGGADASDHTHAEQSSGATAENAPADDVTLEAVDSPVEAQKEKSFNWALWIPVIVIALVAIAVAAWLLWRAVDNDDEQKPAA